MRYARAITRLLAFGSATASVYFVWLCGVPFVVLAPRVALQWRNLCFRTWARATAVIVRMRLDRAGEPPRGPFFLVANHLSYMDIVALAACTDCVFIAKCEVARWPLIGLLARSMNTIFINRRARRNIPATMASIERAFARGAGVVLFAEGTSTAGERVSPFKSSLLELAAHRRIPVHYASVSYQTPVGEAPARQAVCWWGDMTFPRHLFELFQLSEFVVRVNFGAHAIQADDRKVLAQALWSAVNAQFIPAT
jgi:1-acyl-sn-glycerol-3-phosphate acyltransferase